MNKSLLALIVTLLILIAIPESVSSRVRGAVATMLIPTGGSALANGGVEAKVVYRTPATWCSTLWVNAGEAQNKALGVTLIAKDSPVICNGSLVGVVDYVGKRQSRIRLITDSGLSPSVRALRGAEADRELLWHIEALEVALGHDLGELKAELELEGETWHLAKGELHGSSAPLWRGQGNLLSGVGFNYDYADTYGSARDLRTGKPLSGDLATVSILQEGDLLVTTGMDGVFPEGLHVARVSKVEMLREGGYCYNLQARPTAGDMNELTRVIILPPQSPK